MSPFVHHPQQGHSGVDVVGARRVEFRDGIAEVSVPELLGRYERLGYTITDAAGRAIGEPPRNGSTEVWREYSHSLVESDEDHAVIDTLGRDQLVERYAVTEEPAQPAGDPGVVDD